MELEILCSIIFAATFLACWHLCTVRLRTGVSSNISDSLMSEKPNRKFCDKKLRRTWAYDIAVNVIPIFHKKVSLNPSSNNTARGTAFSATLVASTTQMCIFLMKRHVIDCAVEVFCFLTLYVSIASIYLSITLFALHCCPYNPLSTASTLNETQPSWGQIWRLSFNATPDGARCEFCARLSNNPGPTLLPK